MKELISLTEKLADPNLKVGNLDILGLSIPATLGEIGVFGVALSLYQSSKAVNEYIFSRSFESFTKELSSLTLDQKSKFFDKYSNKNIQEFGEQALLILNKIEMPLAAKMMGKAHYLLVLDKIDSERYENYCFIIKSINSYLFKEICKTYKSQENIFRGGAASYLYSLALLNEHYENEFPTGPVFKGYKKYQFGEDFFTDILLPFIND